MHLDEYKAGDSENEPFRFIVKASETKEIFKGLEETIGKFSFAWSRAFCDKVKKHSDEIFKLLNENPHELIYDPTDDSDDSFELVMFIYIDVVPTDYRLTVLYLEFDKRFIPDQLR